MSFPGSQSKPIKKWREVAWSNKKHTSGETPRCVRCSVFGVHYYLLAGYARVRRSLASVAASRPSQPRPARPRVTLVNTSVYLKPTKLVDVTLDMLARLAPCLNLGVGELGHKDLLDTIGADNRRK